MILLSAAILRFLSALFKASLAVFLYVWSLGLHGMGAGWEQVDVLESRAIHQNGLSSG